MSDTTPDRPTDTAPPVPGSGGVPDILHEVVEAVDKAPRDQLRAPTLPRMGLSEAMAEMGTISLAETSLTEVMLRVATLAQATIPGAGEVSVTLLEGDKGSTVAFTGDLAVQLDERQYEDGFGPCMDAARTGGTIPMFDLAREQRYPGFVAASMRAGVTGTLSVGMPLPSRVVGGLNVYARGDDEDGSSLDKASVAVAEALAGHAAIAVANAGLLHATRRYAEQMREAMASRAVIEQAKGLLIAQTGCTLDEAFAHLVQRSRHENSKVAAIAAELVASAQQRDAGQSTDG